ncbi:hypothetical protein [Granulosicoccus antarcticus]|uniref:Uncharacterized protein n=1 Tax=Granulosicoccus antarcticus IMCC3135 TaxID=1192854 RepID=A0A2Z2NW17_9GAMM|nr:hypothetical protein [Granulosicoccus antarcticus]ASJ75646.1 hypothetical protein IMCC3135_27970 [Granulosicoccus antarcticus IMCC3135]
MKYARAVVSWAIALWMCYVFLSSLPYKFTQHPDTQHIFGTIGDWLGTFLGTGIGNLFTELGGYVIGSFELLTSIVLLLPALLWVISRLNGSFFGVTRRRFHMIGGLMASAVMAGAAFFHLVSPLGVEVLHEGKSDGGSLFYAAVSILVLGLVLFAINRGWTDDDKFSQL